MAHGLIAQLRTRLDNKNSELLDSTSLDSHLPWQAYLLHTRHLHKHNQAGREGEAQAQ